MQLHQAIVMLALAYCTAALGNLPPEHLRKQHDAEPRKKKEPEPKGEFFSFTKPWHSVECRYRDANVNHGYVCGHLSPIGEFFRNAAGKNCRFEEFDKSWGYSCEPEFKLTELGALPASMPRLKCDEYWKATCWPSGLPYNGHGWSGDKDVDFEDYKNEDL